MPIRVKATHHIGVVVPDLGAGVRFFAAAFGLAPSKTIERPGAQAAMFRLDDGTEIELMEFGPDTEMAKTQGRGPFIHHFAFEVDDVDAALSILDDAGIPLMAKEGRTGWSAPKVAFLATNPDFGIPIEICQRSE